MFNKINSRSIWIPYNSVVSRGMPFGISLSLARLHLTTVPEQVHLAGQ